MRKQTTILAPALVCAVMAILILAGASNAKTRIAGQAGLERGHVALDTVPEPLTRLGVTHFSHHFPASGRLHVALEDATGKAVAMLTVAEERLGKQTLYTFQSSNGERSWLRVTRKQTDNVQTLSFATSAGARVRLRMEIEAGFETEAFQRIASLTYFEDGAWQPVPGYGGDAEGAGARALLAFLDARLVTNESMEALRAAGEAILPRILFTPKDQPEASAVQRQCVVTCTGGWFLGGWIYHCDGGMEYSGGACCQRGYGYFTSSQISCGQIQRCLIGCANFGLVPIDEPPST